MNSLAGLIRRIKKTLNLKDPEIRQKLYVFSICLGISIVIWFLIVLSGDSVISVEFPVEFKGLPNDMVLINQPDSVLTFRIVSGGFDLITQKYLRGRKPVEIDLSNLNVEKNGGFYSATYATSQLSDLIFRKFKISEELVSISPEYIYFKFEPLDWKRVPVVPKLTLEFEKPYRRSDSLVVIPDSVKIAGPKEFIDPIKEVYAVNEPVKGVNASLSLDCNLKLNEPVKQVEIIPGNAKVFVPVEKFTESSIDVPVLPDSENVKVKTFPSTVKVTFLVSLDNFSRINPGMFKAVISSNDLKERGKKATVRIIKNPSFARIVRVEPEEVEYLVIKP